MKPGVFGVAGNAPAQDRLLRYLQSGRVHPGIILVGPDKALKWEVAKSMAKFLFCSKKGKLAFCGECSSCKRIEKEIHPDVLLFKENEEEALKVETIREITHQMEVAPLEGGCKVCIIDEAHKMNQASANAFLKTLEEPKEGRFFILLTTQLGSFLPTILSRSIVFQFKPEKDAVTFTDEENAKFRELIVQFKKNSDTKAIVEHCEEKEVCLRFVQFLQLELHKTALSEKSTDLFASLSAADCAKKFDELVDFEGRLRSNANYGLMLESLLRRELK
jgi:DNA polymerase III delta prime subunit